MSDSLSFAQETRSVRSVRSSTWPAYAAMAGALVAAMAVLPAWSSFAVAVVGYVVGALLVPVFTVLYRFRRRTAKQDPFYVPQIRLEHAVVVALVIGILSGAVDAWLVAAELAKR
jgi:hypothetical protein